MRPVPAALLAVAALAAVAFFAGLWGDTLALRLAVKPVPALCLLGWVLTARPDRYGVLVAVGLGVSAVGDLLLEVPADLFVFGLLAFLVAHLAYIAATLTDARRPALLRALPFVAWCGALYAWLLPGMGDLAAPVGVYVVVICAMLWRMAARADGALPTTLALLGAISFAVSDSVIAVRKFDGDFVGAREAIMALYWLGQLGIAASAAISRRT
jgi:alkenylglycerophosphocholine hydrolase